MSILYVLLVLVVFGFLLYLVTTYVPMPAPWKQVVIAVAVIFLVVWLLQMFGLFDSLGSVRVGPRR